MPLTIAGYQVHAVETGRFALDGGAMFGVVPKTLWSKSNPPDELNRIPMALRVLLLRGNGKVILVDTGMGDKYDDRTRSIYKLDNSEHTLIGSLAKLGVAPGDVTDIIQTHLHFDHCGGLVSGSAAWEYAPTFPNARVFVQKSNLEWATKPTEKDRASYLSENWVTILQNGLLILLDGPGELFPGVELMIFNGHTQGQQLVHVHDDANHLFFCADLMPTRAHVPFPYIMGYDNFPLTTLEEKKALIPRAYEEKWLMFFEHDPVSSFVRIESTPKGFRAGSDVTFDE